MKSYAKWKRSAPKGRIPLSVKIMTPVDQSKDTASTLMRSGDWGRQRYRNLVAKAPRLAF